MQKIYRIDARYELRLTEKTINIYSYARYSKGKKLALCKHHTGYLVTRINGKSVSLHAIVAEIFHGARPLGMEVNHKDGNKLNNHPENLEYVTPQENMAHAYRLGLVNVTGRNNPAYKHGRRMKK